MEDTFNKLKQHRQNSVDNLIKWMEDSKIVDGVKVTEQNARQLFDDVKDVQNVEWEKFKQAITKLAAKQQKSAEEFTRTLAAEGEKFLNAGFTAATAAASAFKEAMSKK